MKIPEDKQFLLAQREKGRKGAMVGRDETLARKEKQVGKRIEKILARQQTSKENEKGQNDRKKG